MRRSKRHSAKTRHTTMFLFAGCIIEAYGKVFVGHVLHLGHTAKFLFAVCFCRSTRQRFELCRVPAHSKGASPSPLTLFCRGSEVHTANSLPCVRQKTHGKGCLCRQLFAVWPLPCVAHGKAFAVCKMGFAVCNRHTAKFLSPVSRSYNDRAVHEVPNLYRS